MVGEYDMEKEWIDHIHSNSIIYDYDSNGNLYVKYDGTKKEHHEESEALKDGKT